MIFNSALLKKKLPHPRWFYLFLFFFILVNLGQWQVDFLLDNPWVYLNRVLKISNYKKLEVKEIPYQQIINKNALDNNLDPCLVAAVIAQESGFQPNIISHTGAQGLMQIIPGTWKDLWNKGCIPVQYTYQRALEPEANITAGTKYLKILLDKYQGDTVLALAAYNAGDGNVDKYHGVPPFEETKLYIKRIAGHWGKFRKDFPYKELLAHPFLAKNHYYIFVFTLTLWGLLFFWLYRTRSLFQRY